MSQRRRRSADQARQEILDAAEKQMRDVGPAGLRLQEVAKAVGVSHPTVLHHFGSREQLVEAVSNRAMDDLRKQLVAVLQQGPVDDSNITALLERLFASFSEKRNARMLAWLVLSDDKPPTFDFEPLTKLLHQIRVSRCSGDTPPEEKDTTWLALLAALALFADAIAGNMMRKSAGMKGTAKTSQEFRSWLAQLFVRELESTEVSSASAA